MTEAVVWLSVGLAAATALLVVVLPFLGRRPPWMSAREEGPGRDLLAEKESILRAIKDVEFEYENGSLSGEDRDTLRAEYKERAIDVMRRIEAAGKWAGDALRRELEADVAAERKEWEKP